MKLLPLLLLLAAPDAGTVSYLLDLKPTLTHPTHRVVFEHASMRNKFQEIAFVDEHCRCFARLGDGGTLEDKSPFCRATAYTATHMAGQPEDAGCPAP